MPEIVDHEIAVDPDLSGLRIDLDFGDMRTVRMVRRIGRIGALRLEADTELFRHRSHRGVEGLRHLGQRNHLVGADHAERAVLEFEIAFGGFHHRSGHRLGFFDDRGGCDFQSIAADQRGARRIGAAADRHLVGIALDVADGLERHAQPFMHELREYGGVALAVRMGAGNDRYRAARDRSANPCDR